MAVTELSDRLVTYTVPADVLDAEALAGELEKTAGSGPNSSIKAGIHSA